MNDFDLWIHHRSVPAASGGRTDVRSPHDRRTVGSVAAADLKDLDEAVAFAHIGFNGWKALTAYERERIIRKASAHVRTQSEAIGMLMALEQGKPLSQSISEVISACETLDYYAAEAPRIEGWTNPTEDRSYRSWVIHQPVGVCGLITPWNYPVSLLSWKLGPALASGCASVVKPTSVTPMSPLAFCKALSEGGIPPGVINVITGSGSKLGNAMVQHPGIAKIAMTGSSDVGKRILQNAAPFLKKVSLELGGQCPAIVCADADLDLAAKVIAYKGFRNCGQSCSSINRVYVHKSLHESLVQKLRAMAAKLSIGDGITNPSVDLGPLTTDEGVRTIEAHVADAVAQGAELVYGGRRPEGAEFALGNYFLPTLLDHCRPTMRVMREESFGPVVPVAAFDSNDEAIALANDTPYGLVSYLFTRCHSNTLKISEALEAGTVCVNQGAVNTNYGPYSGWKDSGYGVELGRRAIFEYLKTKHIKSAI